MAAVSGGTARRCLGPSAAERSGHARWMRLQWDSACVGLVVDEDTRVSSEGAERVCTSVRITHTPLTHQRAWSQRLRGCVPCVQGPALV